MNLLPLSATVPDFAETPVPPRPRRHWREKFGHAYRGMKLGIRGHSRFFVHFFFTALAVAAAIVLGCDALEWSAILGCIGVVFTAELFNSAIATLYHGLDEQNKPRVRGSLDISAGAVLMAILFAALIGCLVFVHKLSALWL